MDHITPCPQSDGGTIDRVAVSVFAALLTVPLALFVVGVRPQQVENAVAADPPELTIGRLADEAMYEGIASWYEDRLPLRDRAIQGTAWLDFHVFGVSPNPRVLIGDDGWLFLRAGVEEDCFGPARIRSAMDEIDDVDRILGSTGRDLLVVFAANKSSIYPEYLGEHSELTECTDRNRAIALDRIEELGTGAVLETWSVLTEARRQLADPLYSKTDTHWNSLGASVVVERMVEWADPGLWDPAALHFTGVEPTSFGLAGFMALELVEDTDVWEVQRGRRSAMTGRLVGETEVDVTTMLDADVVAGRGVMIHDSFGEQLEPLLRPYWAEFWSVRTRSGPSYGLAADWFDPLVRAADALIVVSTERSFIERFDGSLERRVVGALADELPTTSLGLRADLAGEEFGTRWAGDRIETVGADPRVLVDLGVPPRPGDYLLVNVAMDGPTAVELFWRERGQSFSAERRTFVEVDPGDPFVVFDLDRVGDATLLRIDVGSEGGHALTGLEIVHTR